MSASGTHQGKCFCGAVQFVVTGDPVAMGYCHCQSCRHWSASPVNAFSLWPADAVKVSHGAEHISTYNKTPASYRKWCKVCGGHLFSEHPTLGLVDVYAAMLPTLAFAPGAHVNYRESVLRIHDGVTKFKDFPANMGGSGDTLPE
jgi:hypothetical protein